MQALNSSTTWKKESFNLIELCVVVIVDAPIDVEDQVDADGNTHKLKGWWIKQENSPNAGLIEALDNVKDIISSEKVTTMVHAYISACVGYCVHCPKNCLDYLFQFIQDIYLCKIFWFIDTLITPTLNYVPRIATLFFTYCIRISFL